MITMSAINCNVTMLLQNKLSNLETYLRENPWIMISYNLEDNTCFCTQDYVCLRAFLGLKVSSFHFVLEISLIIFKVIRANEGNKFEQIKKCCCQRTLLACENKFNLRKYKANKTNKIACV